jgi:hypothetical protein
MSVEVRTILVTAGRQPAARLYRFLSPPTARTTRPAAGMPQGGRSERLAADMPAVEWWSGGVVEQVHQHQVHQVHQLCWILPFISMIRSAGSYAFRRQRWRGSGGEAAVVQQRGQSERPAWRGRLLPASIFFY